MSRRHSITKVVYKRGGRKERRWMNACPNLVPRVNRFEKCLLLRRCRVSNVISSAKWARARFYCMSISARLRHDYLKFSYVYRASMPLNIHQFWLPLVALCKRDRFEIG
jgi:hypothetical protein